MNKTKGFTIIELMIIVAIIAILAAIMLPAYSDYVNKPKGSGTQSDTYEPANMTVQRLVCIKDGETIRDEPAIPGERWVFVDGYYATTDANGNPVTRVPSGDCEIKQ